MGGPSKSVSVFFPEKASAPSGKAGKGGRKARSIWVEIGTLDFEVAEISKGGVGEGRGEEVGRDAEGEGFSRRKIGSSRGTRKEEKGSSEAKEGEGRGEEEEEEEEKEEEGEEGEDKERGKD